MRKASDVAAIKYLFTLYHPLNTTKNQVAKKDYYQKKSTLSYWTSWNAVT
jgi:hypothetical protein